MTKSAWEVGDTCWLVYPSEGAFPCEVTITSILRHRSGRDRIAVETSAGERKIVFGHQIKMTQRAANLTVAIDRRDKASEEAASLALQLEAAQLAVARWQRNIETLTAKENADG